MLGNLVNGLDILRVRHGHQERIVYFKKRKELILFHQTGGDHFENFRIDFVIGKVDIGYMPERGFGFEQFVFLNDFCFQQVGFQGFIAVSVP